jgi:glycosyltransferase involved in cell wall biosynthesis
MKLSFVIPAHNEEAYIGKCLASIISEIKNSSEFEVIVVNNASTDKTGEVAASFPGVKVIDEPKKGLVQARRAGYLVAQADLVANIDADTILMPGWIDKALSAFQKNEKLVAFSGPFIYYDLPGVVGFLVNVFYRIGYFWSAVFSYFFDFGDMLQGGNFIIKRSAFDKVGGFNPELDFYGEDTDVARRIHQVGDVVFSFKFPVYASGRRLKGEGIITTGLKYSINFVWTIIFKKPFTKKYKDFREKKGASLD